MHWIVFRPFIPFTRTQFLIEQWCQMTSPFLFSSVAVFQNNRVSPNNNCLQLVNSTLQFVNRFDNNCSQHNKRYKNHASLPYHILIMYCHNNGLHLNTEQDVCSTSGDINTTHLCISHSNHVLSQWLFAFEYRTRSQILWFNSISLQFYAGVYSIITDSLIKFRLQIPAVGPQHCF